MVWQIWWHFVFFVCLEHLNFLVISFFCLICVEMFVSLAPAPPSLIQDFVRFYRTFMRNEASHEFLDKNTHITSKITMKLSKNLTKFIRNTMTILTQGVEISTYIFTSLYLQEHFLSKKHYTKNVCFVVLLKWCQFLQFFCILTQNI